MAGHRDHQAGDQHRGRVGEGPEEPAHRAQNLDQAVVQPEEDVTDALGVEARSELEYRERIRPALLDIFSRYLVGWLLARQESAALAKVLIGDALGHTVQLAYDEGGLAAITDPLGQMTTSFTDGAGRLLARTTPLGQRTNLVQLVDALTHATAYTYDLMDRVAARTDALGHAKNYDYDLTGNLTTVTDRQGQITSTTYDALNRRTQVTYADASTTTYTWDPGSRLVQLVDAVAGPITRTYDGLDRLTQETKSSSTTGST
jgi:YD repeat-containing protein